MAKLIVLSPVMHDGKLLNEGDELTLTDKAQIAALKEAGAVIVKGEKLPDALQSPVETPEA